MTTWIIIFFVLAAWMLLSAVIVVAACMQSSRISRSPGWLRKETEEAPAISARVTAPKGRLHRRPPLTS
jgi:hypothetical protein